MAPSRKTVLFYKISAVIAGAALSWLLIHPDETPDRLVLSSLPAPPLVQAELKKEPQPSEPRVEPAEEITTVAPPRQDLKTKTWRPPAKGTGKVPEVLAWTNVDEAESYGLEISQDPAFGKSSYFVVRKNRFPIEVFPGKTYHWRVKALNAAEEEISDYSPAYSFTAPPPVKERRLPAAATEMPPEEFGEIPGIDWYLPED